MKGRPRGRVLAAAGPTAAAAAVIAGGVAPQRQRRHEDAPYAGADVSGDADGDDPMPTMSAGFDGNRDDVHSGHRFPACVNGKYSFCI